MYTMCTPIRIVKNGNLGGSLNLPSIFEKNNKLPDILKNLPSQTPTACGVQN